MGTCSTGCRTGSTACLRPWACDDRTVEHPFGTLKAWMGATHFLTPTLDKVRTEMSLHVLAYNLKRMIRIFGVGPLMAAIRTTAPGRLAADIAPENEWVRWVESGCGAVTVGRACLFSAPFVWRCLILV